METGARTRASLTALCLALGLLGGPSCSAAGLESLAPEGWRQVEEPQNYGPDDLWKYINGAAEQYLSYGFVGLHHMLLAAGELTVTVDVYDLGSDLNAFGLYFSGSAPEPAEPPIGTAASISPPYTGQMLKGPFFVQIEAYEGEITEKAGREILTGLAQALPGDTGLPAEFGLLPSEHRVLRSQGYVRKGYLGLSELRNCIHVAIAPDKKKRPYTVFALLPSKGMPPEDLWAKLAAKWKTDTYKKHTILYREIPYRGPVGVVRSGDTLLGVVGFIDLKEMKKQLAALAE
jgi:hypothetical protein